MEFGRKRQIADSASSVKRLRVEDDEQKQVNLLDLPMRPMQLIISKLSPSKQTLLRGACPALRAEHSLYMMHKYKIYTQFHMGDGPLMVLAAATEYYINAGYDLIFTGHLLRSKHCEQLEIGGQAINGTQMHQFLHEFYTHVEATRSCLHLKQRRLIHTLTLLNVLRQFRRFRIVSSDTPLLHWKLHIELCGIYFGINDTTKLHTSEESKFIDFLAIMAELLVLDMADETVNRYMEIGQSIYIYGRKQQQALNSRTPRINFKLSILCSSAVRALLEDVINDKVTAASDVIFPSVGESPLNIQLEVRTTNRTEVIAKSSMKICIASLA